MAHAPHGPFLALADHFRLTNRATVEKWMNRVVLDSCICAAEKLTRTELADHLSAVLGEICIALERCEPAVVRRATAEEARQHGQWRWRQGYQLDELVRELDLFRQVLTDALEAYGSNNPQFGAEHLAQARYIVDEILSHVSLGSIREVTRTRY